jgi:ABC-type transport system substrate-binding protein
VRLTREGLTWHVGAPFTAQDEVITQEFEIDATGRFFRIHEVP